MENLYFKKNLYYSDETLVKSWAILLSSFLVLSFPAFAQQEEFREAAGDRAEVIERKITEEAEEELQRRAEEKKVPPEIVEEKREEAPPSKVSFFIKKVVLEGNKLVSSEELQSITFPFVHQKVTLKDLDQLTKQIEDEYTARGYITAYAYVPPQRLEEGEVVIRIVEGKVGDVQVVGNRYFKKNRVLWYSKVKKGEVLKYPELRKSLVRMNENPDRKVKAILRPGKEPETTEVVYKVDDRLPVHGAFTYDNQGTRNIGRQRFGFRMLHNNLLGLDDIFTIGTLFNKNFGAIYLQHLLPIAPLGVKITSGFSHVQVNPKRELSPFGVNGISQTYFVRVEKSLYDGEHISLGVRTGFEWKESRTRILGGTFQRSRLRILRSGLTSREIDKWGTTGMTQDFAVGFDGAGAAFFTDPTAIRQGITPDFFYWRGSLVRDQRVAYGMHAKVVFEWQIPDGKLPPQEQVYFGGATTIRGYPENDYLADLGLLWSFEYYVPTYFFPQDWNFPFTKEPLRQRVEFIGFFDEGYGRLRGASPREVASRHLIGVGGGLQIRISKNLYAQTVWAAGVGAHPLTTDDRHQFHFRLQTEF